MRLPGQARMRLAQGRAGACWNALGVPAGEGTAVRALRGGSVRDFTHLQSGGACEHTPYRLMRPDAE